MLTQASGRTANQLTADLELEGLAGVQGPTVASVLARWQACGIAVGDTDDKNVTRWSVGTPGTVMRAFAELPAGPPPAMGAGGRRSRSSAASGTATVSASAGTKWGPEGVDHPAIADLLPGRTRQSDVHVGGADPRAEIPLCIEMPGTLARRLHDLAVHSALGEPEQRACATARRCAAGTATAC